MLWMHRTCRDCRSLVLLTGLLIAALVAPLAAAEAAGDRPPHGLCVVVPATTAEDLIARTADGRVLVHALATDRTQVASLRTEIAAAGLAGLVTVMFWDGLPALPYADHLINELVLDRDALSTRAPTMTEIERVLIPEHGVARLRERGAWRDHRTAMPAGFGEWTHWFHDATNNPVSRDQGTGPATSLRWVAEPQGGGFDHRVVGSGLLVGGVQDLRWGFAGYSKVARASGLRVRDAFNGLPRWEARNSDLKRFNVPRYEALIIDGDRLICLRERSGPLIARSLHDGRELMSYDAVTINDNAKSVRVAASTSSSVNIMVILHGRQLIAASGRDLVAVDADTGALQWRWQAAEGRYLAMPCVDSVTGMLAVAEGDIGAASGRMTAFQPTAVRGFDPASGREQWHNPVVISRPISNLIAMDGRIYTNNAPGLGERMLTVLCLDARTGKQIWEQRDLDMPGVGTLLAYPHAVFMVTSSLHAFGATDGRRLGSYSLGNSRCDVPRGTATTINNFGHFLRVDEPETVTWQRAEVARNNCGGTNIPAYGLRYASGNRCSCFEAVRGSVAFATTPQPENIADKDRLEQGPAFKRPLGRAAAGWTSFLGNARRSGAAGELSTDAPQVVWKRQIATSPTEGLIPQDWRLGDAWIGAITAPTVADGAVLVGETAGQRLVCLDAATGEERWAFAVDGRLDGPPTIAQGRVVFGSQLGHVICLDLADGALVWRFQAARSDRLISVHGQLASPWPVPSAVPVIGNLVLVNAGHHPEADGGIFLYGLDLATGAIRWQRVLTNDRPTLSLAIDGSKSGKVDIKDIFRTNRIANTVLVADQTVFHLMGRRMLVANGEDVEDHAEFVHMPRWNAVSAPNRRGSQQSLDGPGDWSPRWGVLGTERMRLYRPGRPPGRPGSGNGRPVASDTQHLVLQIVGGSGGPTELLCYTHAAVNDGSAPLWTVMDSLRADHPHVWQSGMVIAGKRLIQTGAAFGKNEWLASSGRLEIRSMSDGALLHQAVLPAAPVDHSIAVANGHLYLTLDDGTVMCLK